VLTIGRFVKLYAAGAELRNRRFELLSREFFMIVNNVILVGVTDWYCGEKLSPMVCTRCLGSGKYRGALGIAVMFLVPWCP